MNHFMANHTDKMKKENERKKKNTQEINHTLNCAEAFFGFSGSSSGGFIYC